MTRTRTVDVYPTAHSFLDALAVVSFKLGCGCAIRADPEPCRTVELKSAGATYECNRHGDQIITRATFRLVGWADSPPQRRTRPS